MQYITGKAALDTPVWFFSKDRVVTDGESLIRHLPFYSYCGIPGKSYVISAVRETQTTHTVGTVLPYLGAFGQGAGSHLTNYAKGLDGLNQKLIPYEPSKIARQVAVPDYMCSIAIFPLTIDTPRETNITGVYYPFTHNCFSYVSDKKEATPFVAKPPSSSLWSMRLGYTSSAQGNASWVDGYPRSAAEVSADVGVSEIPHRMVMNVARIYARFNNAQDPESLRINCAFIMQNAGKPSVYTSPEFIQTDEEAEDIYNIQGKELGTMIASLRNVPSVAVWKSKMPDYAVQWDGTNFVRHELSDDISVLAHVNAIGDTGMKVVKSIIKSYRRQVEV